MDTIKHLIKPHVSKIVNAENEQAALVYAMYEIIEEYLEKIIDMIWCHGESKLAILGGIMIIGDRNSGKTAFCRNIAVKLFKKDKQANAKQYFCKKKFFWPPKPKAEKNFKRWKTVISFFLCLLFLVCARVCVYLSVCEGVSVCMRQ